VVIVSVFVIKKPKPSKEVETLGDEIERLNAVLDAKYQELIELNKQIEMHQIDTNVSLTKNEVKALDIYEQSGIRIPSDIIEDMSAMRLNSVNEMVDYIEIQRSYWKLENTKKAFRRVEAK
jgi:hypothetical protein